MNDKTANKIYENKQYLTKGKRGLIYVSEYKNKKYIIKEKNPESSAQGTIENEAYYNQILNKIKIGPKFYYKEINNKFLIREYIEGQDIYSWITEQKQKSKIEQLRKKLKKIILDVLEQTNKLDKEKINKLELTHPHKDILITAKNKPIIIDFERCKKAEKVKNVTQFCQFLANGKFWFELKNLGIKIDSEKLLKLASEYKQQNYSQKLFKEIKKEIVLT
ncbi:hypothetical protein K9L67_04430 [Candidatus Woesearchaeota archaeon]|nr:hypothetical protein [Candidatus Woesearchaeota archaeon]MCF7901446.1 hypothetical protein [Candidatus Woesearchaeota archaeon]MCF8013531.1 hypothetical protein [Candidatus Woesearchaeota archaeon]